MATHSYLKKFGFSENTISRAIKELIAHGMIYRTRSGGFHQGAALYALTWLPIKNAEGIFLNGFVPCAWRNWSPEQKKIAPPNLRAYSRKNGEWTAPITAKIDAVRTPKFEDIELIPHIDALSAPDTAVAGAPSRQHQNGIGIDLDRWFAEGGAMHEAPRRNSITPEAA